MRRSGWADLGSLTVAVMVVVVYVMVGVGPRTLAPAAVPVALLARGRRAGHRAAAIFGPLPRC